MQRYTTGVIEQFKSLDLDCKGNVRLDPEPRNQQKQACRRQGAWEMIEAIKELYKNRMVSKRKRAVGLLWGGVDLIRGRENHGSLFHLGQRFALWYMITDK